MLQFTQSTRNCVACTRGNHRAILYTSSVLCGYGGNRLASLANELVIPVEGTVLLRIWRGPGCAGAGGGVGTPGLEPGEAGCERNVQRAYEQRPRERPRQYGAPRRLKQIFPAGAPQVAQRDAAKVLMRRPCSVAKRILFTSLPGRRRLVVSARIQSFGQTLRLVSTQCSLSLEASTRRSEAGWEDELQLAGATHL